jgi:hypothetical protein
MIDEDEIGGVCSKNVRAQRYAYNFNRKTYTAETFEDLDVHGRIILKWILT